MTATNEKMMPMRNHCKMPMERIAMENVGNYLRCIVCRNTVCWGDLPNVTGLERHYCFRHQRHMQHSFDYPEHRRLRPWDLEAGYSWGCKNCEYEQYVGMSAGVCVQFIDKEKKKKWWEFWK